MLEKIDSKRRREQQRMRWLDAISNSRHEFEQTPGDNEGQGSLGYFSPWSGKESDITGQLNNNIPKEAPIKYLL